MKEVGKIIKWKEQGFSLGLMVVDTKESIQTIKNKAMEFSFGLTVENTKVIGKKVSSMDRGLI